MSLKDLVIKRTPQEELVRDAVRKLGQDADWLVLALNKPRPADRTLKAVCRLVRDAASEYLRGAA